jgi:hypothetical protein
MSRRSVWVNDAGHIVGEDHHRSDPFDRPPGGRKEHDPYAHLS